MALQASEPPSLLAERKLLSPRPHILSDACWDSKTRMCFIYAWAAYSYPFCPNELHWVARGSPCAKRWESLHARHFRVTFSHPCSFWTGISLWVGGILKPVMRGMAEDEREGFLFLKVSRVLGQKQKCKKTNP